MIIGDDYIIFKECERGGMEDGCKDIGIDWDC